ncbi:uncharacterized protein LOC122050477 [Zingiber officinale]|uniref:uncharacterized protein LOC122050477 n=1 Tax=Zingiber officinale TaxID=94328 RepID=UPI001C4DCA2C|nr:uncharacterized protein LOC122050477 [Zingiber officinale]
MGYRIMDCREPMKQGVVSNFVVVQNKPKENKPNARMFSMTQKEVDNISDVVVGTILINKMTAYVLFDHDTTHSFISKRFIMKLGLIAEILSESYRVVMPTNKAIETHNLHRSCQVSIGNHTFEADLIQLNMIEIDAILGMDWLAKNHALVDYHRKIVKLQTSSQEEIIYHGKAKEKRLLLSVSQTWKAMRSSDEIYLVMISEVEEKIKARLEEIPVVQEFPDVFLEELPGTVPNREVDFEINLAPSAVPISKAPYRMALTQLNELKEQLQELLNKKQIKLSASPWASLVLFVKEKDRRISKIKEALKATWSESSDKFKSDEEEQASLLALPVLAHVTETESESEIESESKTESE